MMSTIVTHFLLGLLARVQLRRLNVAASELTHGQLPNFPVSSLLLLLPLPRLRFEICF